MIQYHPPFSERTLEELILIANCKDENLWQKEATLQAKEELIKREISSKQQLEILNDWDEEAKAELQKHKEWLKNNEFESYKFWEMIVLFVASPYLIFKPGHFNSHSVFTLRADNYLLKIKQRIFIFIIGLNDLAYLFKLLNIQGR